MINDYQSFIMNQFVYNKNCEKCKSLKCISQKLSLRRKLVTIVVYEQLFFARNCLTQDCNLLSKRSHRLLITHAERYQIPDLLDGACPANTFLLWRILASVNVQSLSRSGGFIIQSSPITRAHEMISPIEPTICRGANLTISSNASTNESARVRVKYNRIFRSFARKISIDRRA